MAARGSSQTVRLLQSCQHQYNWSAWGVANHTWTGECTHTTEQRGQLWGARAPTRTHSTETSHPDAGPKPELTPPPRDVHYYGSFGTPHKRLKQVSLGNTIVSLAASPVVLVYSDMGTVGRVGLASTLVAFGIFTTALLHWSTKPYVHELTYDHKTQTIRAKTIGLFGQHKWSTFQLSDVTYPKMFHPIATFQAKHRVYYIERNIFPDPDLLKWLVQEDPVLAAAPKLKDEDD